MNNIAYFEIQSADPQEAADFYHTVFGWEFIREHHVPIEYYRIVTEGIHGGLLQRPAQTPAPEQGSNAFVCSVQVNNFDGCTEKILAAGGQVALPKFAIPGRCWQGYFLDRDNNTFGIFEVDERAV